MWWLIFVFIIVIFTSNSEYRSQDNRRFNSENKTEKAKKKDRVDEMIDKTIITLRKNHTLVSWRRAAFLAVILALPIVYLITGQINDGFLYAGTAFVIFLVIYFSHIFVEHSYWFRRGLVVEDELLKLRNKVMI